MPYIDPSWAWALNQSRFAKVQSMNVCALDMMLKLVILVVVFSKNSGET